MIVYYHSKVPNSTVKVTLISPHNDCIVSQQSCQFKKQSNINITTQWLYSITAKAANSRQSDINITKQWLYSITAKLPIKTAK